MGGRVDGSMWARDKPKFQANQKPYLKEKELVEWTMVYTIILMIAYDVKWTQNVLTDIQNVKWAKPKNRTYILK